MNERNTEFLLHIKVEGPEPKELAEKMCANAETSWDSKERRTTQRKRKTKQKRKKFTNAYIDEFLGNISSTDNDSDDSDGERSDSKIDMLID